MIAAITLHDISVDNSRSRFLLNADIEAHQREPARIGSGPALPVRIDPAVAEQQAVQIQPAVTRPTCRLRKGLTGTGKLSK